MREVLTLTIGWQTATVVLWPGESIEAATKRLSDAWNELYAPNGDEDE